MNVVRGQIDSNVYVVKREQEKGKERKAIPAVYLIANVFLFPETVDTMHKRNLCDRLSYWNVEDRQPEMTAEVHANRTRMFCNIYHEY